MDLGTIKKRLSRGDYKTVFQVAEDVRLVWTNCMTYNADGSDFFLIAQKLSKKFEDRFAKILTDHNLQEGVGGTTAVVDDNAVSLEDKRAFAKSLYKLSREELGKILVDLDQKCPSALVKNSSEDEVELNVDKITPEVFRELVEYAGQCRKTKSKSKSQSSKKSRNQ